MFVGLMVRVGLAVVLAACVALVAGLWSEPIAHAQRVDRDYVDVAATSNHDLNVIVVNNGSRTAYDVEVVVDVVRPDLSRIRPNPDKGVLETSVGWVSFDGTSLRWVIPELGGLHREMLAAKVHHLSDTPVFDNRNQPHEIFGRATTASLESDVHKGNNTSRIWSYNFRSGNDGFIQVGVNYTVSVSADNLNPSPGAPVNFTVKAGIRSTHGEVGSPPISPNVPPPIDLKVGIELTNGLTHNGSPSFYTKTCAVCTTDLAPGSATYRNREFIIGTGQAKTGITSHSMTLPLRVSSDAVVSEQCLTATITGTPPPGTGRFDEDISDNVARTCLGEPPDRTLVFNSGEAGLLTWYDCVERTTYPCSAAASVEIVALGRSAAVDAGLPYEAFKPDKVVIQVSDPLGRAASSEEDSSALVWSTGYDTRVVTRPGVILTEEMVSPDPDRLGADVDNDGSSAVPLNVAVSGPGKLATWSAGDTGDPSEWFGHATNGVLSESGTWYIGAGSYPWYAEFSKLGTYRVTFEGTIAENNGTPKVLTDDTPHPFAVTYVFHVGPIADLEVKAAPAAGAMTAKDQVAFTVTATNHGPDHAPAVRVPITLPAGMEFVRAYPEQDYNHNSNSGIWDIGELKHKEYRRVGLRQSEGETLTIVAELTGDVAGPVTGSIKNHQDYCVRIKTGGTPSDDLPCDGSPVPTGDTYTKHSTIYYDYQPDNDEFSLSQNWKDVAAKNPPYLTSLSISSYPTPNVNDGPGSYLIGDVIKVEAQFSKIVYVTGSPTLRLRIGDEEREAEYAGGSGTDTLS